MKGKIVSWDYIAVALSMLAGYFAGRAHEIFKRVRFNRELLADMQKTTQMARELAASCAEKDDV